MHIRVLACLGAIAFAVTGCALGRDTVTLAVPVAKTYPEPTYGIVVDLPTDNRQFQNKPPSADLPSADADVTKVSAEELSTLIGRKRNTYGQALGDLALPKGATVQTETQAILVEALKRRGHTGDHAYRHCTATIEEFWSWFRPGFWTVAAEARIRLHVTIDTQYGRRSFDATGFGRKEGMAAGPSEFRQAYELATNDLLRNLDAALSGAGI